ncbi:MAG: serine/threonine protein kinase [Candidatus Eremiobacteraeota bacterium]|nr:serine/threonine protein kinase [Candidatus Eremiobacteraeota bacterium]
MWSWPRRLGPGLYVETVPSGCRVILRSKLTLAVGPTGRFQAGVGGIELGRTPGPLQLEEKELPALLSFELPGFEPLERPFPRDAFRHPQRLRLTPKIPVLVPLAYRIGRDFPFASLLLAFWLGTGLLWLGRRRRERQTEERLRTSATLVQGDRIGPYRVQRELGRGGMGVVYQVLSPSGTPLALKLLQPVARPEEEVRALLGLQHPNVVHILDWGEAEGQFYLVMEWVEGQTLAEVVGEQLPDVAQLTDWMSQLCQALAYIHGKSIVHNDLKPSNLMLRDGRLILMDFGIAHSSERPRAQLGTPGYVAPEKIHGGAGDWRSDYYSAACCWFYLWEGRPAFEGRTPVQTLRLQGQGQLPAGQRPMPEQWFSLWSRWMNSDPDQRTAPSSAETAREFR